MPRLSENRQQELINDMYFQVQQSEHDFPVVSDLSNLPPKYKGLAMEINERGNIAVYTVFKNGNCREIASRV